MAEMLTALQSMFWNDLAMGQNPIGAPTPKWDPIGVDSQPFQVVLSGEMVWGENFERGHLKVSYL